MMLCHDIKADVGVMVVEVDTSCQYSITLHHRAVVGHVGLFDKMVSDMEMSVKQRYGIEYLHAEIVAPIDMHRP